MLNAAKAKTASWNRNITYSRSGETHCRGVITEDFPQRCELHVNHAPIELALALTNCSNTSEEPSVGLPREIFCRISKRLEKVPKSAHQGRRGEIVRDRADLVGYEYLRNNACRKPKPEERVSSVGAQMEF